MSEPSSAASLETTVDRLVGRVSHWTPSRWGAASRACGLSRADVTYRLVQRIADLAAVAEGQPQRTVPRLSNDLGLPDQLRVVTRDLLRAGPDSTTLAAAQVAVAQAGTELWG